VFDDGVGFLYEIRGGGFARADGPDRFVGENQTIVGGVYAFQLVDQVAADRLVAGFAYFQRLPDTVEDGEALLFEPGEFFCDELLGLAQDVPALAVAYEHRLDTELSQLLQADLAGEGAFDRRVGVLGPDADGASGLETVQGRGGREEEDLLGVDSRLDLARLEAIIRARVTEELLEAGVSLPDPGAVTISPGVVVGQDTIIYPGSYLLGATQVGEACRIGPNAYLADSQLDDGVLVWCSVLEGAQVGREATVGPFAHLRPGSRVGARARVGNFVELKNASLGEEAKAAHLSYIGDARVGDRANIGAGTITCNYDGVKKHPTEIGPGAFIGSNSALVAPVKIGEGAYVGAGSVITEDVPPYALALGRARQVIKPDWAKNRREARK